MKWIAITFFVFSFCGCRQFKTDNVSPETILEETLKTFTWDEVDQYPAFSLCDSLVEKTAQKQCFEGVVTTEVSKQLAKKHYIVSETLVDTVYIEFKVLTSGVVKLLNFKQTAYTKQQIPSLQEDVKLSLANLPPLQPAIKRGQFVDVQFTLPIVINVK